MLRCSTFNRPVAIVYRSTTNFRHRLRMIYSNQPAQSGRFVRSPTGSDRHGSDTLNLENLYSGKRSIEGMRTSPHLLRNSSVPFSSLGRDSHPNHVRYICRRSSCESNSILRLRIYYNYKLIFAAVGTVSCEASENGVWLSNLQRARCSSD